MDNRVKFVGYAALFATLSGAPVHAVAFHNGPIDGRVIDAVTKQPIPGVFVVAKWQRAEGLIATSVEVCRHVATTMSDSEGRYHIDAWSGVPNPVLGWLTDSQYNVSLDAYKVGMEIVWPAVFKMGEVTGTLQLAPWKGTNPLRLIRLSGMISSDEFACRGADEPESLTALREAVNAEAKAIATSNGDDQAIIQRLDSIQRFRYSPNPRGDKQSLPAPPTPSH